MFSLGDGWHHLYQLHLAAVKLKDLAKSTWVSGRQVSTKYEAQLSSCKGISSFFVVDNHFKNWEAIVRQGPEHAKEGSGYLQYYVLGTEAVEGHALGTVEQDAEEQEGPDEGEHWHISNYLATEF